MEMAHLKAAFLRPHSISRSGVVGNGGKTMGERRGKRHGGVGMVDILDAKNKKKQWKLMSSASSRPKSAIVEDEDVELRPLDFPGISYIDDASSDLGSNEDLIPDILRLRTEESGNCYKSGPRALLGESSNNSNTTFATITDKADSNTTVLDGQVKEK